jgi:hypothetical protein
MLEKPVRILSEPPIRRAPRWLDERDIPMFWTKDPQERFGVGRARPHLNVERLMDETTVGSPERGQFEDEILESHGRWRMLFRTWIDFGSLSR